MSGVDGDGGDFAPIAVIDVELTRRLPTLRLGLLRKRVWILARLYSEPIGTVLIDVDHEGLTPEFLARRLWQEFGAAIRVRFAEMGLAAPCEIPSTGLGHSCEDSSHSERGPEAVYGSRLISVVICTRDRPQQLKICLRSLLQQRYPVFEVIIVDNAPMGDAVRKIAAELMTDRQFGYIVEPRPGLSWARNTGVAIAKGEVIAFLDDDDEADPYWLAGIARGFARDDRIGCVTGSVLPARLDTLAQELYELGGGHLKGRGFVPTRFSPSGPQSPLFPLPPFGAGANMAFSRQALSSIGGFDVALGAGTPTGACEDTLAMTLVLLQGYEIAYEPSAVMWHHHRREMEGLRQQLNAYSVGLTAFYTALLRHRPSTAFAMLGLVPSFASYIGSVGRPGANSGALAQVRRRHFAGLLAGPPAYIRSTIIQRRLTGRDASRTQNELAL